MHIYQLGSDTEVNRDMPTYALEAIEVYPSKIGAIDYTYGASNSIVKQPLNLLQTMVQHGHREHERIRIWRSDANACYDKTKRPVYLVNYHLT